MSSSVFFRFKSQKEPSRVVFDGTGISVFELKREIISLNRLGDGTDFELVISEEDTNEEYDDDTVIIPRSTTVIAKRLPAVRPGRGGAARYVSGKMPQNSKNSHRAERPTSKSASKGKGQDVSLGLPVIDETQSEEQRIAAVMKIGADQWAQDQVEMAKATPIHRGPARGKPANVPDRPPPSNYICYRCGEKGHFIQACPTNDDPAYDGRSRVKRTTGIPRTFLKHIEKPVALINDGTVDDTIQPAGVMVNAEGDWVIAEPDNASWEQYQAKAKVSAAAREAEALGSKELQERGLECSMDKRLFVEPTKTPCCGTTYCHDCITNALLENDLRCPQCSKDSILIDNLIPDDEMNAKIQAYEDEKSATAREKEKSKTPPATTTPPISSKKPNPPKGSDSPVKAAAESTASSSSTNTNSTKKRPAETELKNDRTAPASRTAENINRQLPANVAKSEPPSQQARAASQDHIHQQQQQLANGNYMLQQGMNTMPFPTQAPYMAFPMGMDSTLPMDPALWNGMMMQAGSFLVDSSYQNIWPTAYPQQPTNLTNFGFQQGMMPNGNFGQQAPYMPMGNGFMGPGTHHGGGMGTFSNQQRNTFSAPTLNDEDSAYFRKPVNPHRHQARRNINRPTDYHEI